MSTRRAPEDDRLHTGGAVGVSDPNRPLTPESQALLEDINSDAYLGDIFELRDRFAAIEAAAILAALREPQP